MLPRDEWGVYESQAPVDALDLQAELDRWSGVHTAGRVVTDATRSKHDPHLASYLPRRDGRLDQRAAPHDGLLPGRTGREREIIGRRSARG